MLSNASWQILTCFISQELISTKLAIKGRRPGGMSYQAGRKMFYDCIDLLLRELIDRFAELFSP